jgi:hypothetical protein
VKNTLDTRRKSVQKSATKKPPPPARPEQASSQEPTDVSFKSLRKWMLAAGCALAESGTLKATWRTYRGRRLGPYFRLAYRRRGRRKWIYVGRSAELAGRLRQLLAMLQAPAEERRRLRRLCAAARRALGIQKAAWQAELAGRGLVAKGFEIRAGQQYRNRSDRSNGTDGTHRPHKSHRRPPRKPGGQGDPR